MKETKNVKIRKEKLFFMNFMSFMTFMSAFSASAEGTLHNYLLEGLK